MYTSRAVIKFLLSVSIAINIKCCPVNFSYSSNLEPHLPDFPNEFLSVIAAFSTGRTIL